MLNPPSLTTGSISRGLLRFTLPILFGNVLQSLNGSINSIWVGSYLGETALSATANANIVMFLLLGGVFGLSMATTVLVGQYIGAGNYQQAKHVVGTSTTFFFVLSMIIAALGWTFCEPLFHAMNVPADTLPPAIAYMRVIFLALPFMYLYAFVMAVLFGVVRATGAVMAPPVILTITMLLVRYPLAALLIPTWHADAIWWSMPISSALATLLAVGYYKFGGWRESTMIKPPMHNLAE